MVFFEKKSVGLDIADHTIEVVELGRDKKIHGMGRVSLAAGIVERGKIKDAEKLSEAVKKLLGKTNITTKKIVFGLPESQVYTVFLSAEDDIAKHVPLKKDNIVYSAPVACSKEVLKEWQQFFKKLGIDVIFDAEPLAIIRGLFPKLPKEPVCIVDLGFATTAVMIVDNKGLRHSFSMKTAGNTLTKEIAKTLNISEENAEERKKQVGLSEPNARIFAPLTKVLHSCRTPNKPRVF
jgi:Tfp pilus assembly PilM family ATPase